MPALKQDLQYIPLGSLAVSFYNARAGNSTEDQEAWEEFKGDIKEHGILQPLLARKNDKVDEDHPAAFLVMDGRRRLQALQEIYSNREGKIVAGAPEVPCEVVDVKAALDELTLSSLGNLHRLDMSPPEWAEVISKLKKMGQNQASIAKLLHKTPAWVSMVKEGKAWKEHKTSTSEQKERGPTEFSDVECPACGNLLGVTLEDGKIVLEAKGRESVDDLEKKRAAKSAKGRKAK